MPQVLTKDEMRRRAGLFNVAEAATLVGIEPRLFRYQLERGALAGPSTRIGNKPRRYYTADDLDMIKAMFRDEEKS